MAILRMQRINIYALNKHCKGILEALQRAGVMQVEKIDVADSVFYKENTSAQQSAYKRNASIVADAVEILTSYIAVKKSILAGLKGRTPISKGEYYERSEKYSEVLQSAYSIISNHKKIAEYKAKIINLESKYESLIPWSGLDIPMKEASTKFVSSVVGTLPQRFNYEDLRLAIAECDRELEHFDFEIIFSDNVQTCIFAVCLKSEYDRFMGALRKIGFSLPASLLDCSPPDELNKIKDDIKFIKKKIRETENKIISQNNIIEVLRFYEDYFTMKAEQYSQIENISYTPHTFVMTGYISKQDSDRIKRYLHKEFDAQVELEDVQGEQVPVVLSNNEFAEPVEGVVTSYSPPSRNEIDPTGIMAVFYYVFFGMMFSDAGYGLVMSLACGLAVRIFKNMETGLKKAVKMFFWCGVSTFFWGLMFGSFFGDAVNVIANTFFGAHAPAIPGITVPLWFNPTEGAGPTKLLMFSFLLGMIHLFAGLTMQATNYIRNGKFLYAIYDDISWMLLLGGSVLALLSTEMLGSLAGFMLSTHWLRVGGVMIAVGAVLILLCSARNRNPFKRLIKGAYNLYGVTSYLSDVLSYSRLLALGLATGVVAQVFNQLASMFGRGVLGTLIFIIVFIIGHALNIGISALGAYVHTNRLQFVEFFGKFYEGGGREFKPFSVKTKYYNVKEEF